MAPGVEEIDAGSVARSFRLDPRIPAAIPGFDAPFFQAGLAGYSDAAMRVVARRHGCPFCVTEALLDRTLLAGGRGFDKADLGDIAENVPGGEEDHPLAGQIMGSDPDEMAAAALKMIEQGLRPARDYRELSDSGDEESTPLSAECQVAARTFACIDVNLACPVRKIRNKARGGHWLREPAGAMEILRAVRLAVPRSIPTTVKLRRGSDDSPEAERNFLRIFDAAYELGYSWATVHGRTVEQAYVGPSRWTFLRDLVRRYPDRLIFGSGDVWSVNDIFRMLAYTGVHAVSVARGCIGNPWVFRQARRMLAGEPPAPPSLAEQRQVMDEHAALCAAIYGPRHAGRLMRKFGIRFAVHHPSAEDLRRRVIAVRDLDDWRTMLDEFFEASEGPTPARQACAVAAV